MMDRRDTHLKASARVGSRQALLELLGLRGGAPGPYKPRFADWLALGTGIFLFLTPLLFGFTEAQVATQAAWALGLGIALAAGLLIVGLVRAGRVGLFLGSLAAAAAPYGLGLYYHDTAMLLMWAAAIFTFGSAMIGRGPAAA